jgi:catechol 2,3-dioxygenase-like lactoylglutathione lyase family enzyme
MIETRPRDKTAEAQQADTPVNVLKLGHVVLRVNDVERSAKFWTEIMGFKISDRNEHGMVFLRYGADHHTIALAPAAEQSSLPAKSQIGFDHCALEVGSMDDLFRIRDFLKARGVPITFEGRKGPGCNPGVEFLDPDGYTIELYAGMDQVGWDGKSRPPEQWRRCKSLEEVVANPLP